jgi:hypothetical protein
MPKLSIARRAKLVASLLLHRQWSSTDDPRYPRLFVDDHRACRSRSSKQ